MTKKLAETQRSSHLMLVMVKLIKFFMGQGGGVVTAFMSSSPIQNKKVVAILK